MAIDVERARALTPACGTVHHLNHAGASPSPAPVLDTVIAHLRREAEIGGYEAAAEAGDRVEGVYRSIATLLGGEADEVALLENATRAWDMAFYGLTFRPGDRILTGRAEYASNVIAMLQVAQRTGAVVEVIDDDEHGQLDVGRLADALDERVKLIALTHVPTNGGLVNPAEEVGRLAREAQVPYFLDACQSAGQLALDTGRLGCDVLTATGRKFLRGPRGTGFAWVRRAYVDQIDPPMLDLHAATWTSPSTYAVRADARRLENWESNVAARLGLGAAVDHALHWGLDEIEARVTALAAGLRERLATIGGVQVRDKGLRRCGIVTFTVGTVPAGDVAAALRAAAVNVSVSPREYAQYDLPARGLDALVRASVHYVNDDRDLEALCEGVARLAAAA